MYRDFVQDVEPLKPCMDPRLLEPGRKSKISGQISHRDYKRYVPLYKAATSGDWEAAKKILNSDPDLKRAQISRKIGTVLNVAVASRQTKFVKELVKQMSPEELVELRNNSGNTVLHSSIIAGDLEAAKAMVLKHSNLPQIRNNHHQTPIILAADRGFKDLLWYLCSVTRDEDPSPFRDTDGVDLLNTVIFAGCYDVALHLVQRFPHLAIGKDKNGHSALKNFAQKVSAFNSGSRLGFWKCCIYSVVPVHVEQASTPTHLIIGDVEDPPRSSSVPSRKLIMQQLLTGSKVIQVLRTWIWNAVTHVVPSMKQIHDKKLMHIQTHELAKCICEQVMLLGNNLDISNLLGEAVLLAAEFGTVEVIDLCLQSYPDIFWHTDLENNHNMLHVAIKHRQVKVLKFVQGFSAHPNLACWTDPSTRDNILHLAAKLAPHRVLNCVSGAALQMQRELQWYKEVEKIILPTYKKFQNSDRKTPRLLFTDEHKELVKKGEKWMKDTAQSSMLVATLIATVVFAAAFTVPGGSKNDGVPFLLREKSFLVFAIANAFALFSSATSVLIFLSILTSRYAEEDFLTSLPRKLIFGLSTLFFSIATMMIAFSATFFIMLGHQLTWVAIMIALLASLPVSLFVLSHFHLLVEIFLSTYKSEILQ